MSHESERRTARAALTITALCVLVGILGPAFLFYVYLGPVASALAGLAGSWGGLVAGLALTGHVLELRKDTNS